MTKLEASPQSRSLQLALTLQSLWHKLIKLSPALKNNIVDFETRGMVKLSPRFPGASVGTLLPADQEKLQDNNWTNNSFICGGWNAQISPSFRNVIVPRIHIRETYESLGWEIYAGFTVTSEKKPEEWFHVHSKPYSRHEVKMTPSCSYPLSSVTTFI